MKNFYTLFLSILLLSTSHTLLSQVEVSGCTDDTACNYNALATLDDGSCIFEVDCLGICGGTWVEDEFGNCYNPDGQENLLELDCVGYPVYLTVPDGITSLSVQASGAEGGGNGDGDAIGGLGAHMSGGFAVNPGDVVRIHVGCMGGTGVGSLGGGGGGGGSFVVMDATNEPMVIAGGGGGAGHLEEDANDGGHGLVTELGGEGWYGQAAVTMGGMTDNDCGGGAGAGGGGWAGAGASNNWGEGGAAAGGAGGWTDTYLNVGGYGGGGAGYHGGGGGGGYTGGSGGGVYTGCTNTGGGGGGSYNSGSDQAAQAGTNSGNGSVSIELGTLSNIVNPVLNNVVIYPNPAVYNLTVDLTSVQGNQVTMQVFDARGRLVLSDILNNAIHIIDVSQWDNGIYQVVLRQGESQKTERIVVGR